MTDKQKISEEVNKLIDRLILKYPNFKLDINYVIETKPTKNKNISFKRKR